MRQTQRKFYCDVSVTCRADCWTDNKLLRAKLCCKYPRSGGTVFDANICTAYNENIIELAIAHY